MKRIFLLILILIISISLFPQDTKVQTEESVQTDSLSVDPISNVEETQELTTEEKLCKKAAEDIIAIYDNWDPDNDYRILYPRIKEFIDDFYKEFPDFTKELIVKEKTGVKLSDYERRSIVAYKGLKEVVYDEISRFISNKNFYWGYIDNDLASKLKSIAKKLGDYTRANQEKLVKDQDIYVEELLGDMHKIEFQIDSLETLTDLEVIDDLIEDDEYNQDMMILEISKSQLKSDEDIKKLDRVFVEKLNTYISEKKNELLNDKRKELIASRELWIEEKRATMFDLLNYESRRINKIVSDFLLPLEEERAIGNFDVSDEFILSIKDSNDKFAQKFNEIIRYKFYSGLTGKFGFYIQYEYKPALRSFRLNVLIGTILFFILFIFIYTKVKRSKDELYIRRIAGLDAIDDAIGRATEMGKPIVYDSGIGGYTNIDTIASMLILKSVAKKVAEFKAEIYVPTCDPIIMQISEEMVASGFLDAGYPEDHKKDNIFFLAADQFAFAAGVAGLLARKKPATALHFGYYLAESLLIAEAGFSAGAIQVAGTASVGQLPFFITACDYTLIGEELYAAAAYISRDAQILTNLKLSDFAKLTIGLLFVAGTILLSINSEWTFLQDLMNTR